jgi:hypothetical protein
LLHAQPGNTKFYPVGKKTRGHTEHLI